MNAGIIFNFLNLAVFLPILAALLCFLARKAAGWVAVLAAAIVFCLAAAIFISGGGSSQLLGFRAFGLNAGIFLFGALITLLVVIYSLRFMAGKERLPEYYGYVMLTLGATAGALFAKDFLLLLIFWGILGITLYLLVGISGPKGSEAAKRTLILVGGADALMIFGAAIVWSLTRTVEIGAVPLPLHHPLAITAFLSLLIGVFAKTGVVPLHSWIPDAAEGAPASVMALLPAALDKLVGIYLLLRICFNVFVFEVNSPLSILLMALGSATIVVGVMGAMVQHDLKKLLSFHTVSQVGYMLLGIGTGIPVAVAGGLFHMFNNSIYKSLLFLAGGAVEFRTGKTELSELGGLGKFMPLTFTAAAIAALSISGVPPFNGFFSKWMIYQGIVELRNSGPLWVIWLLAAMFGSALTLASFMKIIHATFLGQWSKITSKVREVPLAMSFPMLVLAALCVLFGVFAYNIPLNYLVLPSFRPFSFSGVWDPTLATGLLLAGLLAGLIIFWLGKTKAVSPRPAYIGGELIDEEVTKVSGVDFYNTIREWSFLGKLLPLAEKRSFGIYEWGANIAGVFSAVTSFLHNGLLHTYIAWIFLGGIILFLVIR